MQVFVWGKGRSIRLRRKSGVGVLNTPKPFMVIGEPESKISTYNEMFLTATGN